MFKDRYNSSESVAGDPDRDWACYSERGRHRRQTRSSYLSLHLVTPPQARRRCATSSRGCAASSGTARATPGTSSTSRASATAWRNRRDSRRQPAARVSRRCPAARAASCTSGPSSNWLDSHKRWSREGGPVTGTRCLRGRARQDARPRRVAPRQELAGAAGGGILARAGRRAAPWRTWPALRELDRQPRVRLLFSIPIGDAQVPDGHRVGDGRMVRRQSDAPHPLQRGTLSRSVPLLTTDPPQESPQGDPRHGDAGVNGPHQPPAGRRPRRRSMAQLRGRPCRGPFAGWPGARAQHDRRRRSAIDGRTTRHAGYGQSLRRRGAGGGGLRLAEDRGRRAQAALHRTRSAIAAWLELTAAAYNLVRISQAGARSRCRNQCALLARPGSPQRRLEGRVRGNHEAHRNPRQKRVASSRLPAPSRYAAARPFFITLPGDHRTRGSR